MWSCRVTLREREGRGEMCENEGLREVKSMADRTYAPESTPTTCICVCFWEENDPIITPHIPHTLTLCLGKQFVSAGEQSRHGFFAFPVCGRVV